MTERRLSESDLGRRATPEGDEGPWTSGSLLRRDDVVQCGDPDLHAGDGRRPCAVTQQQRGGLPDDDEVHLGFVERPEDGRWVEDAHGPPVSARRGRPTVAG